MCLECLELECSQSMQAPAAGSGKRRRPVRRVRGGRSSRQGRGAATPPLPPSAAAASRHVDATAAAAGLTAWTGEARLHDRQDGAGLSSGLDRPVRAPPQAVRVSPAVVGKGGLEAREGGCSTGSPRAAASQSAAAMATAVTEATGAGSGMTRWEVGRAPHPEAQAQASSISSGGSGGMDRPGARFVGMCTEHCSERQWLERLPSGPRLSSGARGGDFSAFERDADGRPDRSLAVTAYRRSAAAGSFEVSDTRTPDTLIEVVGRLWDIVADYGSGKAAVDTETLQLYNFIADRIRAVRQEQVLQRLFASGDDRHLRAVHQMARFHILFGAVLAREVILLRRCVRRCPPNLTGCLRCIVQPSIDFDDAYNRNLLAQCLSILMEVSAPMRVSLPTSDCLTRDGCGRHQHQRLLAPSINVEVLVMFVLANLGDHFAV